MPARTKKLKLSSVWRERIRIGEMMERLQRHAFDECEMTTTQIQAAKLVLSKVAPDLRAVEFKGKQELELSVSEQSAKTITDAVRKGFAK